MRLKTSFTFLRNFFVKKNTDKIFIDIDKIKFFLDSNKINYDNVISHRKIHNDDLIGIVNGLFATSNGDGGILPIQILDQILKLETSLRNQTITLKRSSIMTYYDELNLFEDNKIRDYYRTDNGSMYLIDRPLVYDIYNYF